MADSCLLCRIAAGEVEVAELYRDELAVVFDMPESSSWRQAPVHFLAISREHIPSAGHVRDEHGPIVARMLVAIAKVAEQMGVATTGYRIATNVGDDAGQTEYHLHLHCLGGRKLGAKG
ncbi:MAG: HIT domain-containing protein [Chloroflexi bacterium]|nr:MAG: HIT domain-containing protein [Chloroflexota bacterium]